MNISKDESIITQVAAKIAAELATSVKPETIEMAAADWAVAFEIVRDGIMAAHGAPAPMPAPQVAANHLPDPVAVAQDVFPNSEPAQPLAAPHAAAPTNMSVTVKGTQHGPLPDWLIQAAAQKGVTTVWDNRDSLAANPKRPWFKAADGSKDNRGQDVAFWPPRN